MTGAERRHLSAQRRAYALGHPLVLAVGVGAAISGLGALALIACGQPFASDSSLTTLLPTWAELLWALAYMTGGVLLATGVVRLSLRLEVAGCSLVAGAQLVNVYAVTVIRGPAAGFISSVGLAVAVGFVGRVVMLLRARR